MPGRNESTYRFNYQSQESEAGNANRWQNFELRMHNPDLGRWMAPDPMGQFHSPYVSMGNNPVMFVDPSGGYSGPGFFTKVWNWLQGKGWTDHHQGHIPGNKNKSSSSVEGGAGEILGEAPGYDGCDCGGPGGGSGDLSVFSPPESGPGQSVTNSKFSSSPGSSGSSGQRGENGFYRLMGAPKSVQKVLNKFNSNKNEHERIVADTWRKPNPPGNKQGGFDDKRDKRHKPAKVSRYSVYRTSDDGGMSSATLPGYTVGPRGKGSIFVQIEIVDAGNIGINGSFSITAIGQKTPFATINVNTGGGQTVFPQPKTFLYNIGSGPDDQQVALSVRGTLTYNATGAPATGIGIKVTIIQTGNAYEESLQTTDTQRWKWWRIRQLMGFPLFSPYWYNDGYWLNK